MFDIKDYYNNYNKGLSHLEHGINTIDDDLTSDIDNLINNRFDKLYLRDRYKHKNNVIEIIYPSLSYQRNSSLLLTPDKIRNILSFYPNKIDLNNIKKIVIRPRFIEIGNIELVSLYLRKKRILVLYLSHPHYYLVSNFKLNNHTEFLETDLMKLKNATLIYKPNEKHSSDLHVHPLWYMLSLITYEDSDTIDKFFIKKESEYSQLYQTLNDISYFFSQHGY